MGLLDDAIRQHLDLKRQHGADESEVRRKENEALGPARREGPAGETAPEQAPLEEHADSAEEIVADDELAVSEQLAEDHAFAEEEPPLEEERPLGADSPLGDDVLEEESPFEEPFAPEPVGETPSGGFAPVEETEPRAADLPSTSASADDEDVLEETPEFLQETPEHDRLWFEQKPPRDFDFDDE